VKFSCFFAAVVCLASSAGFSETIGPEVINENGSTRVVWKDGREATLQIAVLKPGYVDVPLKVTENLCEGALNKGIVSCTAKTGVKSARLALLWTKHADKKKIGEPVQLCTGIKCTGNEKEAIFRPLQVKKFFPSSAKSLARDFLADVANDEISCEDYSWLPGVKDPHVAPDEIYISEWLTELNVQNQETGKTENATYGTAMGLTLSKTPKNTLEFTNIDFITSRYSFGFLPLLYFTGNNIGLYVRTQDREGSADVCEITVKPKFNVDSAQDAVEKALKQAMHLYVRGSNPQDDYFYSMTEASDAVSLSWFTFTDVDQNRCRKYPNGTKVCPTVEKEIR
jgi:hypothetical protein